MNFDKNLVIKKLSEFFNMDGLGGVTNPGSGAPLPPGSAYLPGDSVHHHEAYNTPCDMLPAGGDVSQSRLPDLSTSPQTRVTDHHQLGKSFSVSHLLELQGAGNLYHSHQMLDHHRINSHMKIAEGKLSLKRKIRFV